MNTHSSYHIEAGVHHGASCRAGTNSTKAAVAPQTSSTPPPLWEAGYHKHFGGRKAKSIKNKRTIANFIALNIKHFTEGESNSAVQHTPEAQKNLQYPTLPRWVIGTVQIKRKAVHWRTQNPSFIIIWLLLVNRKQACWVLMNLVCIACLNGKNSILKSFHDVEVPEAGAPWHRRLKTRLLIRINPNISWVVATWLNSIKIWCNSWSGG